MNNLNYNGSQYYINGKTFTASEIEYKQYMHYSVDNSKSLAEAQANKDSLGYDYFDRAYYAKAGKSGIGLEKYTTPSTSST